MLKAYPKMQRKWIPEPKKEVELGHLKTENDKENQSELEMYSKEWKKKKKIGL